MKQKIYKRKRIIPVGWKEIKLGDVFRTSSGSTPLSTEKSYYEGGVIPWINSGELASPYIYKTSNYITQKGFENSSTELYPKDTVLVAMYGATAGKASLLKLEACTNQAICAILPNEDYCPEFIKYNIDTLYEHLVGLSSGSARDNLSQAGLKELKLVLPKTKKEQEKLVSVLSLLDRKIELNRQINDNLEEQLRLITSRYIFGSPYLKKKRIGEIATIKAGGDCPITFSKTRTQECNIPIFSNGTEDRGLYGFTNKANIEGHSITVAARGTIGYCERRLMPFVPIIRLLAITPKEDGAYIYLHQVIRGMKFKKNGSVQQQLTVPEISFIEIPYPHSSVLHEYNNVANPIVEMIERNINENEILTKQRDELLPLLMNGQASVNYHLSVLFITKIMLYYKETNINFRYERNNNTKRFRWNESGSVS